MIVRVENTPDAVATTGADVVARRLLSQPRTVLGLPTGRTPVGLYASLRERPIDWTAVVAFTLDEFVGLPASAPRSFRAFMHAHLFDAVGLRADQIDAPDGVAPDLNAECTRYQNALVSAGGLDLLVCGVGANGHIAFNEPGPTLQAPVHVETLRRDTRHANIEAFGSLAAVPTHALTIGMAAILGARQVLVLATGSAKAESVAKLIEGPLTTAVPASWLQAHPNTEVVLDRAAAGRLS
jgi:glucosamine-6-phosphate deaminase